MSQIHVSPSNLERALNCTGYPFLAKGLPRQPQSEAAKLGTLMHGIVLDAVGKLDAMSVWKDKRIDELVLDDAKNCEIYSDKLIFEYRETTKEIDGPLPPRAEAKLNELQELGMIPDPERGDEQHRCDLHWFGKNRLFVLDFKNGKVPVSPENNAQTLAYAWAILKEETLLLSDLQVSLGIYQPKVNPRIQYWETSARKILEFGKLVVEKILDAEEGGKLCEGDWCQWCIVGHAKACPLKQGKAEKRDDAKTTAKAASQIISEALSSPLPAIEVAIAETLAPLPTKALDIEIPEAVVEVVEAIEKRFSTLETVTAQKIDEANEVLRVSGDVLKTLEGQEAARKKPYVDAKKAVELAFADLIARAEKVKKSIKLEIGAYFTREQNKRDEEERAAKAEQDRIAKELKEAEEKAQKGGKGAKKAAQAVETLKQEAAVASVTTPAAPIARGAGLSVKKKAIFDIPDVKKIPARYLMQYDEPIVGYETKASKILVEIDFAIMSKDALAGKLDNADWVKVQKVPDVSAR